MQSSSNRKPGANAGSSSNTFSKGKDREDILQRETFLDDITPPVENNTVETHYADSRDSHDLSLLPEQITRDSLVDNMLLSLDQFSLGQATEDELRLYSSFAEHDHHTPKPGTPRHQYSYSSDFEYDATSKNPKHYSHSRQSGSDSTFQSSIGGMNASRPDPYLAHYHDQPQEISNSRHRRPSKASRASSVGSLDLNYTQETSAKRWLDRQPSFDPTQESQRHERQPSFSEYDAAPTPTVPVGPRREVNHRVPNSTPVLQSMPSFEVQNAQNARALQKPLPASPRHSRPPSSENQDLLSISAFVKDAGAHPLRSPKSRENMTPAPGQKDRPGFFKRVFGGSSRNLAAAATDPVVSKSRTASVVETPDVPRSKTQQVMSPAKPRATTPDTQKPLPTLTKKPSSFFRRRKKSVTEAVPSVPAVPTSRLESPQATKSLLPPPVTPTSSLRQVMNPYLDSPRAKSPGLSREYPKYLELTGQSFTNFADGYKPDKKATIRTVSREDADVFTSDPSTGIPSDKARGEDGATFLRDSSDNELPSVNPGPKEVDIGQRKVSGPNDRSSPIIEKETGRGPESGKPFSRLQGQANTVISSPPSMAQDTKDGGLVRIENDEEWVAVSLAKPALKATERVLLVPEDNRQPKDTPQSTPKDAEVSMTLSSSIHNDSKITSAAQAEENADPALTPRTSTFSHAPLQDSVPAEKNSKIPTEEDSLLAMQIYDGNEEFIPLAKAAAFLGDDDPVKRRTLVAYMKLFNFANLNILASLRVMCGKLLLKAESQQVDRILEAFAQRWCECNPNHGFKLADVVHTICYSILLLNTDLHMADIEQKMTRSQFVKNTLPTIRQVVASYAPDAFQSKRSSVLPGKSDAFNPDISAAAPVVSNETLGQARSSLELERPSWRMSFRPQPLKANADGQLPTPLDYEAPVDDCGPLVKTPFVGTLRTWEVQLEIILKDFYSSIRSERLPLLGASLEKSQTLHPSQGALSVFGGGLRRSPSVLSRAASAVDYPSQPRIRPGDLNRLTTGKWGGKNRSKPRLYASSAISSSRTSFDDQSSVWSPSAASSTWTKYSLGRTQTSMSVDSYRSNWGNSDYQSSIGFASALSQAIIREEAVAATSIGSAGTEELRAAPLLEDESLGLAGAPWAKEGIVKHKHHLESLEKKAKDRSWYEIFAVIEKGYMSLFSFSSKSARRTGRGKTGVGAVVGGGNWQDNAECLGNFLLRQTIASALPPPGYSKTRPHVWALSLPTGAVHLFQVGTPEIVREFVSTANYWSARLSNHPLVGGVSNIEYGWSDGIVNNALVTAINETTRPPTRSTTHSRQASTQSSLRPSFDQASGGVRARLPGDKIQLRDWTPPTQSMRASNLMETDQLNTLVAYVKGIEEELQKHNQLRSPMLLAFTPRHPNAQKAMANWEKKSSYLLREIVKFRTYIDTLQAAESQKQRLYAERAAEKALVEQTEDEEEEAGLEMQMKQSVAA